MTHKRAFLVPVVIDGTPERGASVPEKFHELQWTRLPNGQTSPAFVERIRRLLSPEASSARGPPLPAPPSASSTQTASPAATAAAFAPAVAHGTDASTDSRSRNLMVATSKLPD
jgi:hypothetical protein